MSKCKSCVSERVAYISGKCSDLSFFKLDGREHDGYVPSNMGIGDEYGDYIEFEYCLDCGMIQSDEFPIPESAVDNVFNPEG